MVLSEDELKKEIKAFTESHSESVKSEEYNQFRSEVMPGRFTLYEKACNFCSNIVKLSPDKKKLAELQEALETCHLNTTPAGVTSFAILFPIAFILLGVALSFTLFSLIAPGSSMFFMFMFIIFGLILIVPLTTLPMLLANNWSFPCSILSRT